MTILEYIEKEKKHHQRKMVDCREEIEDSLGNDVEPPSNYINHYKEQEQYHTGAFDALLEVEKKLNLEEEKEV
jgi:hypothetical protein